MEPNYHPDALTNYDYKFDQNNFMCFHIGAKLHAIFGWGYTKYNSYETTPGLKNMKSFDFTKCSQYKDFSSKITINQTHKDNVNPNPHKSAYTIDVENKNITLTYEFN